ncbi:MAG: peptidoglycan DD-metalloendopeptidase family protein [Desulfosalsimonadaceae bacterium]
MSAERRRKPYRAVFMHYDYRSHAATHIRGAGKRFSQKKGIIRLLFCIFAVLLLPAGWLVFHSETREAAGTAPLVMDALPSAEKSANKKSVDAVVMDPWELRLGAHLKEKVIRVSAGDTMINLLVESGLAASEAYRTAGALEKVFDPRELRQGQELRITFNADSGESGPVFQGLRLMLNVDRELQLIDCPNQGLLARIFDRELETRPVKAAVDIDASLYEAAMDADLPVDVLIQVIRAYSFDIDFQRDIRSGDRIEVMYEEKLDQDGRALTSGAVLYASFHTQGRFLPIYRYEAEDGVTDFFDAEGKSVKKTLMVTPIDGARMSSGYGMRRHPIQGYNRMHRGLDFAAPTGTPVMAAGNGIVEYAGRNGSYGHYVRIGHPNEYKTVYAHLSRYANGIKKGMRVAQGDIIGYVGSTGVSTGPHLHYEVHHRGKDVNPTSVKTPPGRILEGEELHRFRLAKSRLEQRYASIEKEAKLAEASGKTGGKSEEKSGS